MKGEEVALTCAVCVFEESGSSTQAASAHKAAKPSYPEAVQIFPGGGTSCPQSLKPGQVVRVRLEAAGGDEDDPGLLCHLSTKSFVDKCPASSQGPGPPAGTPHIAVRRPVADICGFEKGSRVTVSIVCQDECEATPEERAAALSRFTLDLIEVQIGDQYLSRSDQWRLRRALQQDRSVLHQSMQFHFAKIDITVSKLWQNESQMVSGYIADPTRIVFRSRSSKFFIFIQMSAEMWRFDNFGNTLFENAVDGFLSKLMTQWAHNKCNHEVNIVLFSRTYYQADSLDEFPEEFRGRVMAAVEVPRSPQQPKKFGSLGRKRGPIMFSEDICSSPANTAQPKPSLEAFGRRTKFNRDFYRVVALNQKSSSHCDNAALISKIRKTITHYQKQVLPETVTLASGEAVRLPPGFNSTADTGNVLEAMNLALNVFGGHYCDRSFATTGQMMLIVTPGSGVFEVDRRLKTLTKYLMIDYGIVAEIVCLGPPPLNVRPLFKLLGRDQYCIPHGVNQSYYNPIPASVSHSSVFLPALTPHLIGNPDCDRGWQILDDDDIDIQIAPYDVSEDTLPYTATSHPVDPEQLVEFLNDRLNPSPAPAVSKGGLVGILRTVAAVPRTSETEIGPSRSLRTPTFAPSDHRRGGDVTPPVSMNMPISRRVQSQGNLPIQSSPVSSSLEGHALGGTLGRPGGGPLPFSHRQSVDVSLSAARLTSEVNPLRVGIQERTVIQSSCNRNRWADCYPSGSDPDMGQDDRQTITFADPLPPSGKLEPGRQSGMAAISETHPGGLGEFSTAAAAAGAGLRMRDCGSRRTVGAGAAAAAAAQQSGGLTICLGSRRPKRRCGVSRGRGAGRCEKCSMTCTLDHSTEVDWESLLYPVCLPITTSYMPSRHELEEEYYFASSDLDLDALTLSMSPISARASYHSNIEDLYLELISQRLMQGYQIVTAAAATPAAAATAVPESKARGPQNVVESCFLSMGNRSHHCVERVRGFNLDTLKTRVYTAKFMASSMKYTYELWTLSNANQGYEPAAIQLKPHQVENLNWNFINHHVMNHEDFYDFYRQKQINFWRSRFCLLPVLKKSPVAPPGSWCQYEIPATEKELQDRVDKFCRFLELLNGVDVNRKLSSSQNLQQSVSSELGNPTGASLAVPVTAMVTSPSDSALVTNDPTPTATPGTSVSDRNLPRTVATAAASTGAGGAGSSDRSHSQEPNTRARRRSMKDFPATALLSQITLQSSNEDVVFAMIRSGGQVPFVNVQRNVPGDKTFVSLDAVRWLSRTLLQNQPNAPPPSTATVIGKLSELVRDRRILPTFLMDEEAVPNSAFLEKFMPGYLFYTIIDHSVSDFELPVVMSTPVDESSRLKELYQNTFFQWDYFEVVTCHCPPHADHWRPARTSIEDALPHHSALHRIRSQDGVSSVPGVKYVCKAVDAKRLSDRHEYCYCQYNSIFHPLAGFEIEFQWMVASGPLLCHMISTWMRKASAYDLRMVPVPIDAFSSPNRNPFAPLSKPFFIPLNVNQILRLEQTSSLLDCPTNILRLQQLQLQVLKQFGFLPSCCVVPGEDHSSSRDSSHSGSDSRRLQHIHLTGSCLCLVPSYDVLGDTRTPTASDDSLDRVDSTKSLGVPVQAGFLWVNNSQLQPPHKRSAHRPSGDTSGGATLDHTPDDVVEKLQADFIRFCSDCSDTLVTMWQKLAGPELNDESNDLPTDEEHRPVVWQL